MFIIQFILVVLALAGLAFTLLRSIKIGRDKFNDPVLEKVDLVPIALAALAAFVVLAAVVPSFGEVPAGRRGVVLQFGAVTGEVKAEGLFFVVPFVQRVQLMDVQIHAHKAAATAASRDMQDVATEITLNYRLDAAAVATTWRELGGDYEARIITPSVQEAVKAATAKYDAEQLITRRASVRDEIDAILRDRLVKHHIVLDQISITNFQFSDAFADAIEKKQVATQNALAAENRVREATANANAEIARAKGAAEAIRIQAEAIRSQGGAEYVKLQAILAWEKTGGKVPTYVMGGQSIIPFMDVTK